MTTDFGRTPLPSQDGFKVVLAIGAGAALLAFAVASFIPRQRGVEAAEAPVADVPVPEGTDAPVAGVPVPEVTDARVAGVPVPEVTDAPVADAPEPEVTDVPVPEVTAAASAGEPVVGTPFAGAPAEAAVTTAQGAGIAVRGRVLGADRGAVDGAAVTLISLGGKQLGRSVSRSDGSYGVDAPGAGSYVLIAASEGHQPQASTIVVTGEPLAHDVLLSGTSGLAGVVRSADGGTLVADAVVIMTDVRGEVLATERTDVLGEFTVTGLVPGPVTLAASSPKHRPLAQIVEIGGAGTTRVELELRPGAQVRGTVCGGGAPLSDALVTLVDAAGNVVATTRTGVDGAYAFSDLDTGAYTVIATGYPPRAAQLTVPGAGEDDHDIELSHAGDGDAVR
ncbi:collagen binding domain-containing protein [Streptomyces collinus]|uniref:MSCRAMM family protein n=1 Tax=Streptomyces collinus TaxID=42684 RepID=UPI003697EDCB